MTTPTIPLEALLRAHAALEAVRDVPIGDPMPLAVSLKVCGALGYLRADMQRLGRIDVEVLA